MARNSVDPTPRALEHFRRREIELALPLFQQALELGEDPQKHVNERWSSWMLLGEFERAWQESDRVGASFGPELDSARHVLIRCLRGYGDTVQFLRYAPLLAQSRPLVSVQAPNHALPLLRPLPWFARVFAFEDPEALKCDASIECSDLPYLFRTTRQSIPTPLTLSAPVEVRHGAELQVGIAWNTGAWNPVRTLPFSVVKRLVGVDGIRFISLDQRSEGWDFKSDIPDVWGRGLMDTVGLIAGLDLVISADTLIAHLGGTLGIPTWTLLPYAGDWRWMLHGDTTPWYPSMRLFRQQRPGDWNSVIREARRELMSVAGRGAETSH